MDKLQWFFELIDRISAPAKTMEKSLARVDSALKKVEKDAASSFSTKISKAIGSVSQQVGGIASSLSSTFGSLPAMISGAAVGGLAILGGKWMVDSLVFKENTLDSLEMMLKSKEAAERVFKMGTDFAAKTPFSSGQIGAAFEKLVAAGFKEDELQKMMTGIGDLAGTDAQKIDRALMAISQIKGKGKLQGEELMQLAEMGLPMGQVLDQLAKSMGKTKEETQALLSAGKIDANTGIGAIMATINATFGGRMEKASNSLAGLWSTLQAAPSDVLMGLDMEPMVAPIKGLIKDVTKLLAPDAIGGKMLARLFSGAGEIVGKLAGTLQGIDWGKWLGKADEIVTKLWPKLEKLWAGFTKVFGLDDAGAGLEGVLDSISKWLDSIDPKTMETLGQVLGAVVFGVIKLFEWSLRLAFGLGTVVHEFLSFWLAVGDAMTGNFDPLLEKLDGFWQSLKQRFFEGGVDLLLGLAEGILSGITPASAAIDSIGDTIVEKLKSKLGIASPSTVFAELGNWTGLGFVQGLEQSGMNQAIANPITPGQIAAGAAGAGGGGQQIIITVESIVVGADVKDAAAAREHGKAAAESFGAQLTSILRGFATEGGG